MIKIYIEKDILEDDVKEGGNFSAALHSLLSIQGISAISFFGKGEYQGEFPFVRISFKELFEEKLPLTKDIVLISNNESNLLLWDENRGKAILAASRTKSEWFNRIYLKEGKDEILKSIRKYIHI